jgi:hypothetical protein
MTRIAFIAVVVPFLWASRAVQAREKLPNWCWKKEDLKKIRELESEVTREGLSHCLENGLWRVETGISPKFTAEVLYYMTLFREVFTKTLGFGEEPALGIRIKVVVFPTEEEYERIYPNGSRGQYAYDFDDEGRLSKLTIHTYVQYDYETDFQYFYRPILQHEGAHLFLKLLFGRTKVPVWLDEGIAMYFQYWDMNKSPGKNIAKRYKSSMFIYRLKKRIKEFASKGDKLEYLLSIPNKRWNPDRMGHLAEYHYGLAESLVDFFFSTPENKKRLHQILKNLLEKKRPVIPQKGAIRILWDQHLRRILR